MGSIGLSLIGTPKPNGSLTSMRSSMASRSPRPPCSTRSPHSARRVVVSLDSAKSLRFGGFVLDLKRHEPHYVAEHPHGSAPGFQFVEDQ